MTKNMKKKKLTKQQADLKNKNLKLQFESRKKTYEDKLLILTNLYFEHYSKDTEQNKKNYNDLNDEWKEQCNKVNIKQSLIQLNKQAFENTIARVEKEKGFI